MDIQNMTISALEQFTVSEAQSVLWPVLMFILGVVAYSIFIFKFYRFIARKDIFKLNLKKYNQGNFGIIKKIFGLILYVVEYILLFPLFTVFWFITLTIFMTFLGKEQTIQNILLVSIVLVSAVRITAYYNEDLSRDLAKMLPFALLGVFMIDITYFSFNSSLSALLRLPALWKIIIYYLMFVGFNMHHSIVRLFGYVCEW